MTQKRERADKGQPRKPLGQKRKHNWQVLLNDDEDAIVENYLQKEGIDKAFFMRKAMLRAVPKSFRTLDLRTVSIDPQPTVITSLEMPLDSSTTPEVYPHSKSPLELQTEANKRPLKRLQPIEYPKNNS